MKLVFLGTGAADWSSDDFINGKEYRRYSSALIDGQLLIDPGPHIFHFARENGTPDMFSAVKQIIVTHTHQDHFSANTVARIAEICDITLYGDPACHRKLTDQLSASIINKIRFQPIEAFGEYTVGDYSILALPSNHGTSDCNETTLNYVIVRDGKRLFYGLDGGWLFYPVWQKLRCLKFDAMIFEATVGDVRGDDRIFGHNNLTMLETMVDTIRKQGCLSENGKLYCSHMAKTLHTCHKRLKKRLNPAGITPAFDGMKIDI